MSEEWSFRSKEWTRRFASSALERKRSSSIVWRFAFALGRMNSVFDINQRCEGKPHINKRPEDLF